MKFEPKYRLPKETIQIEMLAVCSVTKINVVTLNSKSRKRGTVFARKIISYLFKYRHPTKRVAELLGGQDHSTVIYHQQDVEGKLKIKDKLIIETLEKVRNEIERIKIS
jgi:chromosomal replication initiation ATPase DnaA